MAKTFKAGVARVNVTPPAGNWMAGYPPELGQVEEFPDNIKGFVGRKKPSVGAHDPLWAKALVFDNGDERVAIVSIDTLIVTKKFTDGLRAESQLRWNITPQNLLINTTQKLDSPISSIACQISCAIDALSPFVGRECRTVGVVPCADPV